MRGIGDEVQMSEIQNNKGQGDACGGGGSSSGDEGEKLVSFQTQRL